MIWGVSVLTLDCVSLTKRQMWKQQSRWRFYLGNIFQNERKHWWNAGNNQQRGCRSCSRTFSPSAFSACSTAVNDMMIISSPTWTVFFFHYHENSREHCFARFPSWRLRRVLIPYMRSTPRARQPFELDKTNLACRIMRVPTPAGGLPIKQI